MKKIDLEKLPNFGDVYGTLCDSQIDSLIVTEDGEERRLMPIYAIKFVNGYKVLEIRTVTKVEYNKFNDAIVSAKLRVKLIKAC